MACIIFLEDIIETESFHVFALVDDVLCLQLLQINCFISFNLIFQSLHCTGVEYVDYACFKALMQS